MNNTILLSLVAGGRASNYLQEELEKVGFRGVIRQIIMFQTGILTPTTLNPKLSPLKNLKHSTRITHPLRPTDK